LWFRGRNQWAQPAGNVPCNHLLGIVVEALSALPSPCLQ
jgi:hypothetical protein